jgi:maltose-binding protein MalE
VLNFSRSSSLKTEKRAYHFTSNNDKTSSLVQKFAKWEIVGLLWLIYGWQMGGCHQPLKKKNCASSLIVDGWKLAHFNGGRRKLELICV